MRILILALLAAYFLSGCAGALGLTGTAEQIKELTKDKNAACVRMDLMTPWGMQKTTSVNVDKGMTLAKHSGTVTIRGETCDTSITSATPNTVAPGASITQECIVSAHDMSLAEILRMAKEVPACPR